MTLADVHLERLSSDLRNRFGLDGALDARPGSARRREENRRERCEDAIGDVLTALCQGYKVDQRGRVEPTPSDVDEIEGWSIRQVRLTLSRARKGRARERVYQQAASPEVASSSSPAARAEARELLRQVPPDVLLHAMGHEPTTKRERDRVRKQRERWRRELEQQGVLRRRGKRPGTTARTPAMIRPDIHTRFQQIVQRAQGRPFTDATGAALG